MEQRAGSETTNRLRFTLRLIDAALYDLCDLQPSGSISVRATVDLRKPPHHANAFPRASVFPAVLPRFTPNTEDRSRAARTRRTASTGPTINRTVSPNLSANCISFITLNFASLPRTSKLASG